MTELEADPGVIYDEEYRQLLRERFTNFASLGAALTFAYLYVSSFLFLATGDATARDLASSPWILTVTGVAALLALAGVSLRIGQPSRRRLAATDALSVLAASLLLATAVALCPGSPAVTIDGLLVLSGLHALRAAIVPSGSGRTAAIAAASYVPLVVAAYHAWSGTEEAGGIGHIQPFPFRQYAIAGGVGTLLAAVISRTNWGLGRQVRKEGFVGPYRLIRKIGHGAMGEVFEARHTLLRRPTAVKLLRSDLAGEANLLRFEREVRLMSRLTHPNTISVFDFGRTPDGLFYFAMEYLDGIDLSRLIEEEGAQPSARVVGILAQVCASLEEAHAVGMIHRDIKPGNVILCERGGIPDFVKVGDFGLAREVADGRLVGPVKVSGTPQFLAPEAIHSPTGIDHRADIYSVGAVGYYLLSAARLFDETDSAAILRAQIEQAPRPLRERVDRAVPEALEAILFRCLEKDREKRFASARELRRALEELELAEGWTEEDGRAWWQSFRARRDAGESSTEA